MKRGKARVRGGKEGEKKKTGGEKKMVAEFPYASNPIL